MKSKFSGARPVRRAASFAFLSLVASLARAQKRPDRLHALVVMTDGLDQSSRIKLDELTRASPAWWKAAKTRSRRSRPTSAATAPPGDRANAR